MSEFSIFVKELNNIKDIETFIVTLDKKKEEIYNKCLQSNNIFNPIKLEGNIPVIKRERNQEMNIILSGIESIINFSKEKQVLLVYLSSNFWNSILKNYNEPDEINIFNCYKLREAFIKYNYLINQLFKDDPKSEIKKDINKYFERDEFAFLLNKNIKKFFELNKELSNSEILGFVMCFDPYYKEDKYSNNRDNYIFDYINLDNNDVTFIETFHCLEFEKMFKDNVIEFLNKMISKIKNISNFGTILEIIDIRKISKVNEFFELLKDKYDSVVNRQIDSLTNEKLKEAAKILAKFVDLIYIHEKNCNFIERKIKKLDKKIRLLIYNELMKRCKGDEYKMMKEFIYNIFLKELDNIDNIIELIDNLDKKDKKYFLEELMKKFKFTKEEYYSNFENKKILLLCELNEKGKLKISDEDKCYRDFEQIIYEIHKDLEGEISIKNIEEFLMNEEKVVKKRLGLIQIIFRNFDPEYVYSELKNMKEAIKKEINELIFIKNSLLIFHRHIYQYEIRRILDIIRDIKENDLKYYKSEKIQELIQNIKKLKHVAEEVSKVKDFIFFKVLYDESLGNDQEKRFNEALKKLDDIKNLFDKNASINEIYKINKEIFNKIKEKLRNNESRADIFIRQMINYFNINNQELINDLILIFKSKKYEMDINGIIYFFERFQTDNKDWNEKLSSKLKNLSEMDLKEIKKNLKKLKDNGIYDYEKTNNY